MAIHNWTNERYLLLIPLERWDLIKEGDTIITNHIHGAFIKNWLVDRNIQARVEYVGDPQYKIVTDNWFPDWKERAIGYS